MTLCRKKKFVSIFMILLVLFSAVIPAFAVTDGSGASGNVVRMGYFDFGGMFEGASDGIKKSGYCYDYMMQVAAYTGWNLEFVYGTYAELYEMLKNGEIDILPYTNYNEQRDREVLFSEKVLVEEEYYIAVKQNEETVSTSLDGAVISTLNGADYNRLLVDYIKENGIHAELKFYSSLEETWNAVLNGESDATVFTSNAYIAGGWDCICTFGKKPTYIAVASHRPELLAKLNEATSTIDVDCPALLGELYALYFSDNPMRCSLSTEEIAWIEKHPVLHVGGFVNDAPYYFLIDSETGKAEGLTVDVINGIIERLHIHATAEFKGYHSLDEMKAALETGEIDVIIPFYSDQDVARQNNLIISKTVRVSNMEIVYKKGTSYPKATEKIATPSTKLGIFYVQDIFPESEIVGVATIQEAVDKLRSGEATGAVAQNVVLHNIKEKYDDLNYVVLSEGCGTCFATLTENYPLIRILNRGLNYFSVAEISAIASLYNPEPNVTTREYLATHKEAVILIAVIIVIFVILIIALLQVSRLKKKADEASRSKSNFLFNMSHDIRTPMNAITGFTNMAKKNVSDGEKIAGYLDKIDIAGQQLLMLVNQILEMARIESGKVELAEKPVDIRSEFESMVTVLCEQAKANGLELYPNMEGIIHNNILADPARINSITLNIIGNSIKYTPNGGRIDYTLKEIPARKEGYATYVLTVADTGIGMSEEYIKVLFDPFTRENNSTVSKIQGAGLGMSIVKNLVDLMNGNIKVQSKPGVGTRFDVTLDFRIIGGEENHSVPESQSKKVTLKGKRALIVEDNEMNREIASDILREIGIIVEQAEDGTEAVRLLKEKGSDYYDFILMDIQMPVMNGYEATGIIRRMYPDRHIPIIALSANAFAEDKTASANAGMDDHVAKPIDINELITVLAKFDFAA